MIDRESLLKDGVGRDFNGCKRKIIRCIGTYDGNAKEVQKVLQKHWHITADTDLEEVIPKYPSVTYRRGPNLRDMLVYSNSQTPISKDSWLTLQTLGSYPCGSCSFCNYLPRIKEFSNPIDVRVYKLKQFINCKSKSIVYVASCNCPKLYVGKNFVGVYHNISAPYKGVMTCP